MLLNLATNARDAMPDGGTLELRSDVVEVDNAFIQRHGFGEAARYAVIRMSDNGQGMDKNDTGEDIRTFFHDEGSGKGQASGWQWRMGLSSSIVGIWS